MIGFCIASILTLFLIYWYQWKRYCTVFFKSQRMCFEHKHILITGGSKGIGLAIAKVLSSIDCRITLMARNRSDLLNSQSLLESNPSFKAKIHIVDCDVCSGMDKLKDVYRQLTQTVGVVDILINCAGFAKCDYFEATDVSDFERSMQVNFLGSVKMTKLFMNDFSQQNDGGQKSIVYFSSIAGQIGIFGYSAYTPTKFAIEGLSQVLQMEFAHLDNLNIMTVFPPDTDTPGYKEENTKKPQITTIISDKAGLYSADYIAEIVVKAIKGRKSKLYFGFNGYAIGLLSSATSIPPDQNILLTLCQILFMGVIRLVMLVNLKWMYTVVRLFEGRQR